MFKFPRAGLARPEDFALFGIAGGGFVALGTDSSDARNSE
ncbi:hypothetical protein BIWAKO_06971 [Bosea sp. BIWAKO-01]|nr:hypothetical protein BIWAKO_06971 [Bosea sp. BIWAKO-01]